MRQRPTALRSTAIRPVVASSKDQSGRGDRNDNPGPAWRRGYHSRILARRVSGNDCEQPPQPAPLRLGELGEDGGSSATPTAASARFGSWNGTDGLALPAVLGRTFDPSTTHYLA